MRDVPVELTWQEACMASGVGCRRYWSAVKNHRKSRVSINTNGDFPDGGWTEQIEGACGELAVGKLFNLHWSGSIDTFLREDDLPGLEIKTRSKHDYQLLIRPYYADAKRLVLVTGKCPSYLVRGWLTAGEGRVEQWLTDLHNGGPPVYLPPNTALRSLDELQRELKGG